MRHIRLLPLGVIGRVSVFLGTLASITLAPASWLPWIALVDIGLLLLSLRPPHPARLLHPRRLLFLALLALPPIFLLGPRDSFFGPVSYSGTGLAAAGQITIRFVVILLAVEGLTWSVEIAELAALFERMGLRGLGFALGVAMNMLPALQRSSLNAWQALQMRGGWRRHRISSAGLLILAFLSGALRQAEETALAAEARAFSPDALHPWPLSLRPLDRWMAALMLAWTAGVVFLRFAP